MCGRKRHEVSPAQVMRALFPGGTITGCPKVRTMQIIRELETAPRRAYTGSLGYLNHDGTLDSNIPIRTFMHTGAQLRFRAGAGIVADLIPSANCRKPATRRAAFARAGAVSRNIGNQTARPHDNAPGRVCERR